MRGATLVAIALLAACYNGRPSQQQQEAATAPTSAPTPPSFIASSPEYAVAEHVLRLVVTDETCIVEHRTSGAGIDKLTLDLRPPCQLPTWRQLAPVTNPAVGVSDGVPIGTIGDPIAWRYASAKGVVVLAVIGDPVPEKLRVSSLYRLRERQGLSCASSVQGILLHVNQIQLSKKREHAGVFCAELGLEEKDFWMLAHP